MKLWKGDIHKKFDTIVFAGNGCIENGIRPLRRILDRFIIKNSDSALLKSLLSSDSEASHQLAVMSYTFKLNRAVYFNKLMSGVDGREELRMMKGFNQFRDALGSEYSATSDLSLRIDDGIKKVIGRKALVVTTNWDQVLWSHPDVVDLIQLHGRCDWSESLVFPTELIVEDTPYDLNAVMGALNKMPSESRDLIFSSYRWNTSNHLLMMYMHVHRLLKKVKRIVIWGYSLSDYDADINTLIGTWSAKNELLVINPELSTLKRAIALTKCENAKLFDPKSGMTLKCR